MKKAMFTFLALTLVTGFAAKDSMAAQMCWNTAPNVDNIKVNIGVNVSGHQIINGARYYLTNVYPIVGSLEKDPNGGTSRFMSFFASAGSSGTCGYDTVLDSTSSPKYQGTWSNHCTNGANNSGTMVRINCTTLAPLSPATAEDAPSTKISSEP